jgi:hypothetical protein
MSDSGDLFFVVRSGEVWACFFDGRPPIKLDLEKNFWASIDSFAEERFPSASKGSPTTSISNEFTSCKAAASRYLSVAAAPTVLPQTPPPRSVNERIEPRHEVSIVGRAFASGGSREVIIGDLSEKGCRFDDYSGMKTVVGARLTIKIGMIGPVPSTIRWVRDVTVGVSFDNPLQPYMLDHIRQQFSLR